MDAPPIPGSPSRWSRRLLSMRRHDPLLLLGWTALLGTSLLVNFQLNHRLIETKAKVAAQTFYEINLAYRSLITRMGGVYASTARVAPNPYLSVPDREIPGPAGSTLTLVNPAYMTRMAFETLQAEFHQPVLNKLTSLKPVNPGNAPTEAERKALLAFEGGATEAVEVSEVGGQSFLFLMRPFVTQEGCLKCHANQGYRVGDIRGAIKIGIPMQPYLAAAALADRSSLATHSLVWAVGCAGLLSSARRRRRAEAGVRASEAERERIMDQLNHSHKLDALGQLAGGVAHDFNNLLGSIMGAAELLSSRDAALSPEKRGKYLDMILTASNRAGDLTRKLLQFSRKGPRETLEIQLGRVLQEVVDILQRTLDKKVVIRLERAAAIDSVRGDPSLLQSVFLNMGINSSHAMADGGELVFRLANRDLDAAFCAASGFPLQPGAFVEVEVRDEGCGMPPEVLARIFEPFFTTRGPGEGTGLGLAAAWGTILDHQGAITVFSRQGVGTVFKVYLPVSGTGPGPDEPRPELRTGRGAILVVEDEEILRLTLQETLEHLGYRVRTAADGQEGVEQFRRLHGELDLVILDMIMPVLGGRPAFEEMRRIDPTVPVIVSSGHGREADFEAMEAQGLAGILQKPYRREALSQLIDRVLRPSGA